MRSIVTAAELDAVLREPLALLYKHSDSCPISTMSLHELARLDEAHDDVPLFVIDVHAQRPLARYVAERLGVRHESPQIVLLRAGEPLWHASHYGVNARAIERALAQVEEAGEMREAG